MFNHLRQNNSEKPHPVTTLADELAKSPIMAMKAQKKLIENNGEVMVGALKLDAQPELRDRTDGRAEEAFAAAVTEDQKAFVVAECLRTIEKQHPGTLGDLDKLDRHKMVAILRSDVAKPAVDARMQNSITTTKRLPHR